MASLRQHSFFVACDFLQHLVYGVNVCFCFANQFFSIDFLIEQYFCDSAETLVFRFA